MISEQLKVATRLQHRRVERQLGQQLFSPALTREGLIELLRGFLSAYSELEASCGNYPAIAQLLSDRSKLDWLKQDIAALKGTPPESVLGSSHMHDIGSEGQAWGMLYVMEGATLGGQVIVRQLSRHAWLAPLSAMAFFSSYGVERAQRWQEFLTCLNAYAKQHPDAKSDITDGALYAFATIARALPSVDISSLNCSTENAPHETAF